MVSGKRAKERRKAAQAENPTTTDREPPSGFGRATLFTDVHPQHRINARFFIPMFEMLHETTLATDDQQRVLETSLLLVVNKLATTYRHLARYQRTEARLLEEARKKSLDRVVPVSHDPELYRACDDFLIQLRDGLSRVWRLPRDFVENWPLTGMPESVEACLAALTTVAEGKQAKYVQSIVQALKDHRSWVQEVLSRAEVGLNPLVFQVFVASAKSGDPREAVPIWTGNQSVGAVMNTLWENFYLLSELVVGMAFASRIPPSVALAYIRQPLSSGKSSWKLMAPEPRLVTQPGDEDAVREALALKHSGRPMLQAKFQGKRIRIVGNMGFDRPLGETFHEFLWWLFRNTLGEHWWTSERGEPENDRHQIIRWFDALVQWKQDAGRDENRIEGGWRARPSGDVQSLTALAYDVYTLLHAVSLPPRLVARLKDRVEFQGAKYEVAVAAIFARAGFTLKYLEGGGKHCEFIATHASGLQVGVEAKSRRRAGVLHEKGELDRFAALRGDVQALFDDAKQQKPDGLPFLIFIDINAPLGSATTASETPWVKDLHACLETHEATRGDRADPFNALVVTNFSAHYVGRELIARKGEGLLLIAKQPADPLPESILREVLAVLERYGSPPEDLERFEKKQPESSGGESA